MAKLKEQIDNLTVLAGDFNAIFSIIELLQNQKGNKTRTTL